MRKIFFNIFFVISMILGIVSFSFTKEQITRKYQLACWHYRIYQHTYVDDINEECNIFLLIQKERIFGSLFLYKFVSYFLFDYENKARSSNSMMLELYLLSRYILHKIMWMSDPSFSIHLKRFSTQFNHALNIFEDGYEIHPIHLSDTRMKASHQHRNVPNRNPAQTLPLQADCTVGQPKRYRTRYVPYTRLSVS